MPIFSGLTFADVLPQDTPNEGRVKINDNFHKILSEIDISVVGTLSASTIVSGSTNIDVVSGTTAGVPLYTVSLKDNIDILSISADSYFVGSVPLELALTGSSLFVSGTTGNFSIKANNDSGIEASGNYSYAEGYATIATDYTSHAEGSYTIASGISSHAEGSQTMATGFTSHAEGNLTIAGGDSSHAEGEQTIALGNFSHAEGQSTNTIGISLSSSVNTE